MWIYEKKLEYPIKISNPNPAMAKVIIPNTAGRTENWPHRYAI